MLLGGAGILPSAAYTQTCPPHYWLTASGSVIAMGAPPSQQHYVQAAFFGPVGASACQQQPNPDPGCYTWSSDPPIPHPGGAFEIESCAAPAAGGYLICANSSHPAYESACGGAGQCVVGTPTGTCSGGGFVKLRPRWVEQPGRCGGAGGGQGAPPPPRPGPGRPVDVITGNVYLDQTDVSMVGARRSLQLTRSYNSVLALERPGPYGRPALGSTFGPGWTHSYEIRLRHPDPDASVATVEIRAGDGQPVYYRDEDADGTYSSWIPGTDQAWVVKTAVDYKRHYRDGRTETFDLQGRIRTIADAVGVTTSLDYDALGRLKAIQDGLLDGVGRRLSLTYSGTSSLAEYLRGPGDETAPEIAHFTYTSGGFLETVTYADGDGDGTSDGGFTYTYASTSLPLLTEVRDSSNKPIEAHTYHPTTNKGLTSEILLGSGIERYTLVHGTTRTTVTDARSNVTVYERQNVAGLDLITSITGPCGSCGGGQETQSWVYDDAGRIQKHTDGAGVSTSYTYYPNGDLETETRRPTPSTTHVTSFTYYPDTSPGRGRLYTRTEPNGAVTTYTYVDAGPSEISQTASPSPTRTTRITYRDGKPQIIEDPRGKTWELHFTDKGDLEWIQDPTPAHHRTSYAYDSFGRLTQVIPPPATSPTPAPPITLYDVLGRVRRVTNTDGTATYSEYTYDGGGRLTRTRDARGTVTEYLYDAYGRLEFTKNLRPGPPPLSPLVTEYKYDAMSNVDWIKDARGKLTDFGYDAYNRVDTITYPGAAPNVELFEYDGAGRVAEHTDRKGLVTAFSYDGLGRLTKKDYSDTTPDAVFTYDEGPVAHRGRLTSAANGTATLAWTYDLAGQVLSESATRATGPSSLVAYTYDAAGNRVTLALNGASKLEYFYDDRGLPEIVRRLGSNLNYVLSHDAASRRQSVVFPPAGTPPVATRTDITYDSRSRLETITTSHSGIPNIVALTHDEYDPMDNLLERLGPTLPAESYGYDDVYRLETVQRGTPASEAYTYDAVGNRLSSLAFPSPQWAYSDRNALGSYGGVSLVYDANGNLISKSQSSPADAWTYEWDVENRLKRVTHNSGEVATYNYDPLGRRNQRNLGTILYTYVYDGEDILFQDFTSFIMEENMVDPPPHFYIHGPGIDEPLAVEHGNGAVWYYHTDGLGSVIKMTEPGGSITQSRQYDAFGNLEASASSVAEGYAYTGREWDPESGLYYYRARYYDPKIGRFISEDPIGFDGGINLYTYVDNNPVNYTDPSGNFPIIAIAPFIPALTDAAIATGAVLLAIVGGTAIAETWPPATVTTDPPGGGGATTMAPPRPKPIPAPPPPPPQQCGDDPGKRLKCLYRCEKQISHVLPPAVRAARLELCIKRCMAIDW